MFGFVANGVVHAIFSDARTWWVKAGGRPWDDSRGRLRRFRTKESAGKALRAMFKRAGVEFRPATEEEWCDARA